ncbi:hypothetical protein VNO78_19632 [Psophocarpus tetragonolobus]|uniref:Uncharacterized protein n=1 Tax=Psophocarpus tetragonolobus TaxID=3891 RepID=A0AAN9S9S0_PSOTE
MGFHCKDAICDEEFMKRHKFSIEERGNAGKLIKACDVGEVITRESNGVDGLRVQTLDGGIGPLYHRMKEMCTTIRMQQCY